MWTRFENESVNTESGTVVEHNACVSNSF